MKVLITGATGFIGSNILKKLIEEHYEVVVIKRTSSDITLVEKYLSRCDIYDSDIDKLDNIFIKHQIDAIIHCAIMYDRTEQEYDKLLSVNVKFPLELLKLAVQHKVKLWINTDSFFQKQLEKENNRKIYMEGYVLSKKQFQEWGKVYAKRKEIGFISLQLEHVYGENDRAEKFVPYIYNVCKNNVCNVSLSEGSQIRDFVYVGDVAWAYIKILNNINTFEKQYYLYEVGTGVKRTVKDFVGIIHKAVHSTTCLNWGERDMNDGEMMCSVADNKLLRQLGWCPEVVEDAEIEQIFSK